MTNNLKLLRIRAGLTQKEAAEKLGTVTQGRLSHYEQSDDLSSMTLGTLNKFADLYGVTVDKIIYPLPEKDFAENVLDCISEQHVTSKEAAEDGDLDAVINNRFM